MVYSASARVDDAKRVNDKKELVYVTGILSAYCPGSKEWEDRDAMLKAAEEFMTSDRPLPPKKSDGRPLGLFDVNEGSKKGIIQMFKALQEISGLDEAEWAAKARIIIGDWLTSNNIRGARKDRMDDINSMERLDYVDELKKPNYADAKALIRHSLISRILLKKDIKRWADLAEWKPTLAELTAFAQEFVGDFTLAINTESAKNMNDDYFAHSQYFIRDALIFCVFEHSVAFADAGGAAKEQAWFFSRFGIRGRTIPSDLYWEQTNFWVKRINIAKGSGVTIKHMIEKGSAAVEAFREVSHQFARTFGFADRARRHKEVDVGQDLRLLTETLMDAKLHVLTPNRPIYAPLKVNKKGVVAAAPALFLALSRHPSHAHNPAPPEEGKKKAE
ncbi:hypothetical protein B0H13DRAFT_2673202 [Mycena leptocephala]|nr:hypothetical protein B0H13DRAFT_2673202 [Mycena leptocephala]